MLGLEVLRRDPGNGRPCRDVRFRDEGNTRPKVSLLGQVTVASIQQACA